MRCNFIDQTGLPWEARVRWEFLQNRKRRGPRQTTRATIDIRPKVEIELPGTPSLKLPWLEGVLTGEAHLHPLDAKDRKYNRVDGQRHALERAIAGQSDDFRMGMLRTFADMRKAADAAAKRDREKNAAAKVTNVKQALAVTAAADRAAYDISAQSAEGDNDRVNLLDKLAETVAAQADASVGAPPSQPTVPAAVLNLLGLAPVPPEPPQDAPGDENAE
jgi:hypothetical protein